MRLFASILDKVTKMKTKCLLCEAVTSTGPEFYDHLEDIHMMPIRRERIGHLGKLVKESHNECIERFVFSHIEYGSDKCWCPECVGGKTLDIINSISSNFGGLYIKHK